MELNKTIQTYLSLHPDEVVDHQKFSEYALTHHSTSIEGSTLTEEDIRLLLDEGATPKGKPLEHSLMVKDHYQALQFALEQARAKKPVTLELIQTIAGMVLKNTGKIYNTVFGSIDSSKGSFRKGNVSAGGSYFINYDKVEPYTKKLVEHLQKAMSGEKTRMKATELSFAAHFDLVSIHPFYDGNGRTSRLLMNYIQAYYNLPLATVYKEDRAEYFQALAKAREKEDTGIFQIFMKGQYQKLLTMEINSYQKMIKKQPLKPRRNGKGHSMFF